MSNVYAKGSSLGPAPIVSCTLSDERHQCQRPSRFSSSPSTLSFSVVHMPSENPRETRRFEKKANANRHRMQGSWFPFVSINRTPICVVLLLLLLCTTQLFAIAQTGNSDKANTDDSSLLGTSSSLGEAVIEEENLAGFSSALGDEVTDEGRVGEVSLTGIPELSSQLPSRGGEIQISLPVEELEPEDAMQGQQLHSRNMSSALTVPLFNVLGGPSHSLFRPGEFMASLANQVGTFTKSLADNVVSVRDSALSSLPLLNTIRRTVIVSYRRFQPLKVAEMLTERNTFLKMLSDTLSLLIPIQSIYLKHLGMEIFDVPDPFGLVEFTHKIMGFNQFVEQVFNDQVLGSKEADVINLPNREEISPLFGSESGDMKASRDESQDETETGGFGQEAESRRLGSMWPNDPLFSRQWGHQESTPGWGIETPKAWELWTGEDVKKKFVVALIDSGVDYNHQDLRNNIWRNPNEICGNNIDDDRNGLVDDCIGWNFIHNNNNPMDDNGHGTASAGVIAAEANNGIGIVGVCWGCSLMILKSLNQDIQGTISGFVRAIDYAVGNGAKVSNNSYGGRGSSFAGLKEAVRRAESAGMIFVAAAGNYRGNNDNDKDPVFPASYAFSNVISVAATNRKGQLTTFSSFGKTQVDIAAPGEDIFTCAIGGGYVSVDGTSFAVPFVTGAVSLIWTREPHLKYDEVIDRVCSYTKYSPFLNGRLRTSGILDVWGSMTMSGRSLQVAEVQTSIDSNKCSSHNPCSKDAACSDTDTGIECICNPGFTGNGYSCMDVNECDFNPCGVAATCTNTPGSFTCKCNDGFKQVGDVCQDIDECQVSPRICPRPSKCINFVGSFDCLCPTGSAWNGQKEEFGKCLRINSPGSGPCVNNGNCGLNSLCKSTGSFWFPSRECKCLEGYVPLGKYDSCIRQGILTEQASNYLEVVQAHYGLYSPVSTIRDPSIMAYSREQLPELTTQSVSLLRHVSEPSTSSPVSTPSRPTNCMFGICLFAMGSD